MAPWEKYSARGPFSDVDRISVWWGARAGSTTGRGRGGAGGGGAGGGEAGDGGGGGDALSSSRHHIRYATARARNPRCFLTRDVFHVI